MARKKRERPVIGKKLIHISGKKKGAKERITYQVVGVRYRDSKKRISKFTTKKKLSAVPLMKLRVRNKRGNMVIKIQEMKKYKTKLMKRKKPISLETFQNRIRKRKGPKYKTIFEGELFFHS